ncbi:ATP-binding protein [Bailinhaonella thermotolerans]|uniref:ATPase n=1 Tax=Bailinhaonella thermotolerans TaxID=1070861 RepID=A0A3A4B6W9_9ACTN|nr:NB-ARC domain-containing protein [Bailinhaonella thermotolerans]RJL34317.1 ATPase [Bailinhaonella thermotolerans]
MGSPATWRRDGNVPDDHPPFVGRAQLLTTVEAAVRGHRLVTLHGMGGIGKTRLAIEVARRMRDGFHDGTWLVDLSHVRDPELIVPTISEALHLDDRTAAAPLDTLVGYLGDKELLLILDTCDRLIVPCRAVVERIIAETAYTRLLATSRQELDVTGEYTLSVQPLQVPAPSPQITDLRANESVALFTERARVLSPDFEVNLGNMEQVGELCRRLEGVPLAITLAAARLSDLTLDDLLDRSPTPLAVLENPAGSGGEPRQDTMMGSIGWSHELLEPHEKHLWARLSVFPADFDLDAAQEICAADGPLARDKMLGALTSLAEKAVLMRRESPPMGARYRLIETIRQYGEHWLRELGDGLQQRLAERHRDYYAGLARMGEDAWSGPDQVEWYQRMRMERPNLHAAMDYCATTPGEAARGQELAASLWFLWVGCGLAKEGHHYLSRLLEAGAEPSRARCRALWVHSYVATALGDPTTALQRAVECRQQALAIGDAEALVFADKMFGTACYLQEDYPAAQACLQSMIEFHGQERDLNPGLLPAIVELALVHNDQGAPDAAASLLADCVQFCEERGESWLRSYAYFAQARTFRNLKRHSEAQHSARESLRIKLRFRDTLGILLCIEELAQISAEDGQAERATRLLGAAQANWGQFGSPLLHSSRFRDEHEQCKDMCRAMLGGQPEFDEQFVRGARLDLDMAIRYALDTTR